MLPRQFRLPLQPPAHPTCRVPVPPRHRRRAPASALQDVDLTGSKGIRLWTRLRKKIAKHAVKRNYLAHYTVIERFRQDSSFVTMYLSRSMLDSLDKARQEIDLRQLEQYERSVRQVGTGIEAFFAKVSAAGDASHSTSCETKWPASHFLPVSDRP